MVDAIAGIPVAVPVRAGLRFVQEGDEVRSGTADGFDREAEIRRRSCSEVVNEQDVVGFISVPVEVGDCLPGLRYTEGNDRLP